MSFEPPEILPVNVRKITEKRHVILRLDQLQRAVLEHPERFDALAADRSLNHVRKEVEALQAALLKKRQDEALFELQVLQRVHALLQSWESETELKDILMLDTDRCEYLEKQFQDREKYLEWLGIIERMREERQRIFSKYLGYFEGQQTDMANKKEETQKKLRTCLPKMEECRLKLEPMTKVQQEINFYTQKSMNWLVGAMGAMLAITLLGYFSGLWGGWFWGLLAGYGVFSSLAYRYAYVEGEAMQELYTFLSHRFEIKNIKPFFRYENPQKPIEPTRYDATRGEVLAGMLQKEIRVYRQEFTALERSREDYINYLQYIESRTSWCQEQLEKIQALQELSWNPVAAEKRRSDKPNPPPVVPIIESDDEAEGFARIPDSLPEASLVQATMTSETLVHTPANEVHKPDVSLAPDRAS